MAHAESDIPTCFISCGQIHSFSAGTRHRDVSFVALSVANATGPSAKKTPNFLSTPDLPRSARNVWEICCSALTSHLFQNVAFLRFALLLYRVSARAAFVSECLVLVIHVVAVLYDSFGNFAIHAANT